MLYKCMSYVLCCYCFVNNPPTHVTGVVCFVQFDCSFTASAIAHELLAYSDVGRAVDEQRAALKTQWDRIVLLTESKTNRLVLHPVIIT